MRLWDFVFGMGLVVIIVAVVTIGIGSMQPRNNLPEGATIIEERGNGWVIFKMPIDNEDRRFLYRRNSAGHSATECVTEIR